MSDRNITQLIKSNIVWDNHACMPLRSNDNRYLAQLERYRQAGFNVVALNITFDLYPWYTAFKMLATFRQFIAKHDEHYCLVESVDDIYHAKNHNKLAIFFDIEGGIAVDDSPQLIQLYYDLGVRWMLLAYNKNNRLGGGCQDHDTGLTDFGREVINCMEQAGMVLCCSHTGEKTAKEAIEYSSNPIIFSHSNAAHIYAHERNISDDLIRMCAETGGVINVNGIAQMLGSRPQEAIRNLVNHIEHIANLVGAEHIGLGFDFAFDQEEVAEIVANSPEFFPPEKGYADGIKFIEPFRVSEIVAQLLGRGWTQSDIAGLLGENNMRVAKAVWK